MVSPTQARLKDYTMTQNKKIIVIGSNGCGKSTFAKKLGAKLSLPVIDLDQIFWKPNRAKLSSYEMATLIDQSLCTENWIIDGNCQTYHFAFWPKATMVIWLDYSFLRILWRVLKRTLSHIIYKLPSCGQNYDIWHRTFFSKDSSVLLFLKSYFMNKSTYPKLLKLPAYHQLRVLRFRSPAQAEKFLKNVNSKTMS
jgi:adenylate kinase family enzyme